MVEEDVPKVTEILNNYLADRKLHIVFCEAEVSHFFLPRDNVIYTYVHYQGSKLTDVFSFYSLPS